VPKVALLKVPLKLSIALIIIVTDAAPVTPPKNALPNNQTKLAKTSQMHS